MCLRQIQAMQTLNACRYAVSNKLSWIIWGIANRASSPHHQLPENLCHVFRRHNRIYYHWLQTSIIKTCQGKTCPYWLFQDNESTKGLLLIITFLSSLTICITQVQCYELRQGHKHKRQIKLCVNNPQFGVRCLPGCRANTEHQQCYSSAGCCN